MFAICLSFSLDWIDMAGEKKQLNYELKPQSAMNGISIEMNCLFAIANSLIGCIVL